MDLWQKLYEIIFFFLFLDKLINTTPKIVLLKRNLIQILIFVLRFLFIFFVKLVFCLTKFISFYFILISSICFIFL